MKVELRPEIRRTVSDLLDRFHVLLLTLGAAATVASLYRVSLLGWHPGAMAAAPYFLGVFIVLLLRRRLPVGVSVGLMIAMATIRGAVGMLTLGPDATSFIILVTTSAVVAAIFGFRIGVVFLAGVSVMSGVIATLICSGIVKLAHSTDPLVREPQTWVYQVAGLAVYSSVILIVEWELQRNLTASLSEVSAQAEQLRESEERYRLLADNMRDFLFSLDMDQRFQFVSPSVERLFGFSVEEFLELEFPSIFAPGSRDRALESYRHFAARATEGEFEVPPQEFEFLRKDGSTFWAEVNPTFLCDDQGRLTGAQGILRDITLPKQLEEERSKLESELHQAEKLQAIGELAGGIAHDFNNQLTPIMVHADLLQRGFPSEPAVADHASKILRPARNAADLTAKLLAFARKGKQEQRPVDMHEVISEVTEILVRGIDRRIRVKRHFEAVSAVVEGDRTQLQNVMLNLGLNARDAMPDGGEIVFRTQILEEDDEDPRRSAPRLLIAVGDTGCGMDDSVRQRVFEPFFTTKPVGKGTGMGLSAAYGTVASHGGLIELSSVVGRGTEVRFVLPLSVSLPRPKTDTLAEKVIGGSVRALIIDDEDGVREALVDLLDCLGCSAVGFDHAAAGIAYFGENWREIDVVLLDLVLPDVNGREALEELRKINPDVRVVLMSGFTADEGIVELQRDREIEFLEKPFLLADLTESLTRLSESR